MMDNKINIFMTAIQYPCGEGSSCCGPVGQKDEEIIELKNAIQGYFKCTVEIIDVKTKDNIKDQKHVIKLINSFGLGVLPLVTLDDDIVSMGTLSEKEIFELLLKKLKV